MTSPTFFAFLVVFAQVPAGQTPAPEAEPQPAKADVKSGEASETKTTGAEAENTEGKPPAKKEAEGAGGGEDGEPAPEAKSAEAGEEQAEVSEEESETKDPNRLEVGVLPAINFDSDTGTGVGVILSLAKFAPGADPYAWRMQALAYMTIKDIPGAGVQLPYHDDYLQFDLPGLGGGSFRLSFKFGFARQTNVGYYGIGNAAPFEEEKLDAEPHYYMYDLIRPNALATVRAQVAELPWGDLELFVAAYTSFNEINVYENSKLEEDLAGESGAKAQSLLVGWPRHGLFSGWFGLLYDSRDHETVPQNGLFFEASVRGGTGLGQTFYYSGVNVNLRGYKDILGEYLVVAGRFVFDALFDQPPLYDLAGHGGLEPKGAVGGGSSVRGVRSQRRHGKIKLITSIELRSKILPFTIFGNAFNLGLNAFGDAGRVWTGGAWEPTLDGTDAGIYAGVGGGLRLQWGETFIIRADVGYSPTDDTLGIYIDVGHVF